MRKLTILFLACLPLVCIAADTPTAAELDPVIKKADDAYAAAARQADEIAAKAKAEAAKKRLKVYEDA